MVAGEPVSERGMSSEGREEEVGVAIKGTRRPFTEESRGWAIVDILSSLRDVPQALPHVATQQLAEVYGAGCFVSSYELPAVVVGAQATPIACKAEGSALRP